MGAVTARVLAERGARVVVLDVNLENAQHTAESIGGFAVSADVSNGPSVEAALQSAIDEVGRRARASVSSTSCSGFPSLASASVSSSSGQGWLGSLRGAEGGLATP